MDNNSFLISVSFATGCYRHIRLSSQSTLFCLHQSISDAFEVPNSDNHEFNMDNKKNSKKIYAQEAKHSNPSTKDVKLCDFSLDVGSKFKYSINSSYTSVFTCKVLKIMDKTEIVEVVKSVGQASFEAKEEENVVKVCMPKIYSAKKLKDLYEKLDLSSEKIEELKNYFRALTELYAITPLSKVLDIYNAQNTVISQKLFLDFCDIIKHEHDFFSILSKEELLGENKVANPIEQEIIQDFLLIDDTSYENLKKEQEGKAYYIPDKQELLKYADEYYVEKNEAFVSCVEFIKKVFSVDDETANDITYDIQTEIALGEEFKDVLDHLLNVGIAFDEEEDLRAFLPIFMDLHNNTRVPENRGFTPKEIHELYVKNDDSSCDCGHDHDHDHHDHHHHHHGNRQKRSTQLPAHLNNARNVLSNHALYHSFYENKQVKAQKVGRNDPCTCGSGKKYKRCCGK